MATPTMRNCCLPFFAGMLMTLVGCSTSSPPISISLTPSTQAIDQSQTLTIAASVVNDNSSNGVSWSLTGPGSLSATTGPRITYNSPTTAISSVQQVTVTATSIADGTKSASVQITVNPYPAIPFQSLANGTVGTPYSQLVTLGGGTAPFQWSVYDGPILTGYQVGGSVPDGLTLNTSTGAISGTPTGAGTWYFEATVTDSTGATVVNGFLSIQISPSAAPANPIPFLNQPLSPTAVSPGSADFTLSVSGTGFLPGAAIHFNGAPLATTFVDHEHLTATVPAANVANPATAAVTVVNPSPGGGPSNVVYFQVAAAETNISFTSAPGSPLQMYAPFGMTVADFNEDGKPDLAIAASVNVNLLLGNGDGTFAAAPGSPVPVPSPPYDDFASPYVGPIVAADFDSSGHLGFAVGLINNEAAAIFLGHGNGTFTSSTASFASTFDPTTSALAAADFNADGNLDLAVVNQLYNSGFVALGYGEGAFNQAGGLNSISSIGFPSGIAVGDFNADGKLDVIVAGGGSTAYPSSGLAVSLGNGDGTFSSAKGSPISSPQYLYGLVTADFNGDGKLDVAVTSSGGNAVMVLLGHGDGTFDAPISIPVGTQPEAMVAGDFNRDGKLDLAVANFVDNTITILFGNGDGTFTPASGSPYPVGKAPYQLVTADFNGDGKLDLAVANLTDGTVSILLQQ